MKTGQQNTPRRFIADVSRCAVKNQTYCIRDDSYPLDVIQRLIQKKADEFLHLFSNEELPNDNDIVDRTDLDGEIELCDLNRATITPTSAKNKDGVELYIFNTDTHKQFVRVSTCRSKGRTCKSIVTVPNEYHTECTQNFVYHDLLSLSPDGKGIKETFPFPACCSCAVFRN